MDFGNALDGRNGVPFKQELQDQLGLLDRQVHAVKRFVLRLPEPLRALAALIALVALTIASLALTFDPA
jgi:hypothetical protein